MRSRLILPRPESIPYVRQQSSSRKRVGLSTAIINHSNSPRPGDRQSPPRPMTMLQHGNSDPFSASSVQITPFNNYLINSWQNIFVQTVYPSEVLSKVSLAS